MNQRAAISPFVQEEYKGFEAAILKNQQGRFP